MKLVILNFFVCKSEPKRNSSFNNELFFSTPAFFPPFYQDITVMLRLWRTPPHHVILVSSVFSEPKFQILAIIKQETFVQRAVTAKEERTVLHRVLKERSQTLLKIKMCQIVVHVQPVITVALKVLMVQRMNVMVDTIVHLVNHQVGQQILNALLVTTVHLEVQYS